MVQYSFEDVENGDVVLVEMPMAKAVDFGDTIRRKGRKLRRIVEQSGCTHTKPILGYTIARSLPRNYPGADFYMKDGTPGFHNDRTKEDFCMRSADNHEEPVHTLDDII